MPFGDRTGPRGMGSMTGRGAGYCSGFNRPGFANPVPGRGWFGRGYGIGFGRGMGMGRRMGMGGDMGARMMPPVSPTPQSPAPGQDLEMLEAQSQMLAQQLGEIQRRIEEAQKKQQQASDIS